MPRLAEMTRENIPVEAIPRGFKNAYVTAQKRLYVREDKKFVGFGFKVRLYDPNTRESTFIIVEDYELIDYF